MDIPADPSFDPEKDKRMLKLIVEDIQRKARTRKWITVKQRDLLLFAGEKIPIGTSVVAVSKRRKHY